MLFRSLAEEYDSRSPQQRFRDARHQMQQMRIRNERERPEWKQTYSPIGR